ncbi:hypothetical protein [Gallaecimonas xiamenensis]|uniref:Uncharacterized protein n=1 Tax=Gallaecimonas xiamenensis 3-C-1 TaxID=745411 RepID=K2JRH2_9GAMM|nr:hypothetical protein [Gallaecimonas xiamenensis]EKE67760.1 hypothetical protein B3C1_18126 [Gallaecimonas xiamenensis 3-C-1]
MINKKMAAALAGLGMAIGLSFTVTAAPDCSRCRIERFDCLKNGGEELQCDRQYRDCMLAQGCIIDL